VVAADNTVPPSVSCEETTGVIGSESALQDRRSGHERTPAKEVSIELSTLGDTRKVPDSRGVDPEPALQDHRSDPDLVPAEECVERTELLGDTRKTRFRICRCRSPSTL
jgi:hypothetical protein